MTFPPRHRKIAGLAALGAVLFGAGCTTLAHRGAVKGAGKPLTPQEVGAVLSLVRQVGWNEVMELMPVLEVEPNAGFPGLTVLTQRLRAVAARPPADATARAAEIRALMDQQPDFWKAYYEIAPGDPLASLLHVGLLLAAGEAARADAVATLAINFGRMDLEYRKELVRLNSYAQLLVRSGEGDGRTLDALRRSGQFSGLADRARALLAVWPQDPGALAYLAEAEWGLSREAPGAPAAAELARTLAALRRADPLAILDPRITGPAPADLAEARGRWVQIDDGTAIGDDQLLLQFSKAAQAGGLDELALVARSLLVSRDTGLPPLDERFVKVSLRRLVGEPAAGRVCADAFAEDREWIGMGVGAEAPPPSLEGSFVHPQLEQRQYVQIAETSYWIESGFLHGTDLAEAYLDRGVARARLLQRKDAVADLREALRLDPGRREVRYRLAVTLSDAGDYAAADAVFAAARKRAPPNAVETQAWGDHLFKQGRFAEAGAAYRMAARLDPDLVEARIMEHLARVREGRPDDARIPGNLEQGDSWGVNLLRYLAGQIDQRSLFDRLEPQGGLHYSDEECELYFVLAELALGRGDVAEARRDLRNCLGTGMTDQPDYAMAWRELLRLNAGNPPPPGKQTPSGDAGDEEPA